MEHFKGKKPVYVREMGINLHSTAIMIYSCSCFHTIVNEISRNKTKKLPETFDRGGGTGRIYVKYMSYIRPAAERVYSPSTPLRLPAAGFKNLLALSTML